MTTTPSDDNHPHYAWGPSGAKTWIGCPGSINKALAEKAAGNIPERTETEYSREGTRAHDYAEKFLTGQIKENDIPAEFWEHLQGYCLFAQDLAETIGRGECVVMNEQAVPLFYNPGAVGTLDYAVVAEDGSEVAILDLKYGAGVYVSADENPQLAIYALSFMAQLEAQGYVFTDETEVSMYIYQPRHYEFTGDPEKWTTTYRDLKDMGIDIQEAYERSKAADPAEDLRPSEDACQFCDAKVVCTKRITDMFDVELPEQVNPLVPANQDEPQLPLVNSLTDEARVAILKHHRKIIKWMADVMDDSLALLEQGGTIEGLKVVAGKQGNRTWGDNEEEVAKLLRKIPAKLRYKPRRVLSPAQAEKVLKAEDKPLKDQSTKFRNRWEELIVQRPGRPTLALAEDERPALITGPDVFDSVVDEDDCF